MNLGQFRTALRPKIGSPSTADVPDTPNLDGHINNAYQEILNKYKFLKGRCRAKFTTVAGTDKYDLATLTDVVLKVWDRTNGKELRKRTQDFSATHDFSPTGQAAPVNGKPTEYLRYEGYIQLWPPPDGVYEIEMLYKIRYTALVQSGDSPVLPTTWHRGMLILAAAMYYDDEALDFVKSRYHMDKFKEWVSDQPLEIQEELQDIDSGVEVPTLGANIRKRLDFDRSP